MLKIVLASASPRRIELLRELVSEFEVFPAHVDEDSFTCDDPVQTALRLATLKAREIAKVRPDCLVIGGDTVVAVDSVQLAKPRDPADAVRMLSLLSGRTHRVITALCLWTREREECFAVTTEVEFRPLSLEEMESYASSGEPLDKAGAYAIQGGAKSFVCAVNGSLTNVIGLPLEALKSKLNEAWPGTVRD